MNAMTDTHTFIEITHMALLLPITKPLPGYLYPLPMLDEEKGTQTSTAGCMAYFFFPSKWESNNCTFS